MATITTVTKDEVLTTTTTYEINDESLWTGIWGSGFENDPVARNWFMSLDFIEGDWDKVGVAEVKYVDEKDTEEGWNQDKWLTKRLTIDDLVKAFQFAMTEGYSHVPCGGAIDLDTERWDGCVGDIIIQLAVYGKEVWA